MKKFIAILIILVTILVIAPKTFAELTYLPTKASVTITPTPNKAEVQLDVPQGKIVFIFSKYLEQENNLILGNTIPVNPGRYVFSFLTKNVIILSPDDDDFANTLRDIVSTSLEKQSVILFLESKPFATFINTVDSLKQTTIKENSSS